MQGIGGFLCSFCVDGAIWRGDGQEDGGQSGRRCRGQWREGSGRQRAAALGRCWDDGGQPGAAACGLGAWWGKLPADGGIYGAGVAEKGPGGLGDASIDYPLPFSTSLRTSGFGWRRPMVCRWAGGGHRAGLAAGDKSDGRQGGRRGGRLNREEGPAGRWAPAEGCGTGQDGGDMVTGGWRERSGVVDWLGRCPRRRNDGRGTREAGWFLHPTGGRGKTGGCLAGMGPAENPVAKTGNF